MELVIPEAVFKAVADKAKADIFKDRSWGGTTIDHREVPVTDLKLLAEACDRVANNPDVRSLKRRLKQVEGFQVGSKKFTNIELLTETVREYVSQLPNRWVFVEDKDTGQQNPYFVEYVNYEPPRKYRDDYQPAQLKIKALAIKRGDHIEWLRSIDRSDLENGVDPLEALTILGCFPETPEMVATYKAYCDKYEVLRTKTGKQMVAMGNAVKDSEDYWFKNTKVRMDKEGQAGRVVIDDAEGWKSDKRSIPKDNLLNTKSSRQDDEDLEIVTINLPIHPYIRVFDMRNHLYLQTHVDNISEYIYDRRAFDRVVISPDTKTLIDALVMSDKAGDDIIAGKGKGVVVLSSGPPGTGKTLTAEAYSERAKKPLYNVQCSQLGLDPETLEKELSIALDRSVRWGAILLLDEADVYIRARGDDLQQNAIVGVFLRLLEYYTGVLFMTTNRITLVDDAILSRCLIHVHYELPDGDSAFHIWQIMWDQFGGGYSEAIDGKKVLACHQAFPNASGRTIKQLIRLAKTMAFRLGKPMDVDMVKWVARYQDVEKIK